MSNLKLTSETVSSQHLGHLGLIASTLSELGLIAKIDRRIKLNKSKGGIVSYGERVAAMVLNGLGFMNSRLYMTSHFFEDKPVAQLFGSDICSEHFNDDCLGRALDEIAHYGTTKLYSELAFEIATEQGLLGKRLHLDSTSFSLHGRYDVEVSQDAPQPGYGFSKAHRPDLKQVMLSLVQGGVANLPLWMESLDGNSSDKSTFHETVKKVTHFFQKLEQAPEDLCFVVDAAFYDGDKLSVLDSVKWITRVPATKKEAKEYLSTLEHLFTWQTIDENYSYVELPTLTHKDVSQRWTLYFSGHAFAREERTFIKRMQKKTDSLLKALWHLEKQTFGCPEDAEKALKSILKKMQYHQVHHTIEAVAKHTCRGRPAQGALPEIKGYRIKSHLYSDLEKVSAHRSKLGRFILATNLLETTVLSNEALLSQYKEQSQVEAGFKFMKNDSFELDSFFLKTPKRIGALMMIMTLCLMVYNFAQYQLRRALKENEDIVPNQHGKPTSKPTLKWVAELLHMIAVVYISTDDVRQTIITNVNQVHRKIIGYFGQSALRIYGLPLDYKQTPIEYSNYKNLLHWYEK